MPVTSRSFVLVSTQVRQAVAEVTSAALHRAQVSGALVLLQADRRHAHRHFPNGDARSPTSNDIIAVSPPHPTASSYPPEAHRLAALEREQGFVFF